MIWQNLLSQAKCHQFLIKFFSLYQANYVEQNIFLITILREISTFLTKLIQFWLFFVFVKLYCIFWRILLFWRNLVIVCNFSFVYLKFRDVGEISSILLTTQKIKLMDNFVTTLQYDAQYVRNFANTKKLHTFFLRLDYRDSV